MQLKRTALIPIKSIDPKIIKLYGQAHSRAHFELPLEEQIKVGTIGKFVSAGYASGTGLRRELAKGKIISVDARQNTAKGEIYTGTPSKSDLAAALELLSIDDFFEPDPDGSLEKERMAELMNHLVQVAEDAGYQVSNPDETLCKYDLNITQDGITKRVALKSLNSIEPQHAQLTEAGTNDYFTKSCTFTDQDIFAVSLYLRTGSITDFAFAPSVSSAVSDHGLASGAGYPAYVVQRPLCHVDEKVWFSTLDGLWPHL